MCVPVCQDKRHTAVITNVMVSCMLDPTTEATTPYLIHPRVSIASHQSYTLKLLIFTSIHIF